MHSAIVNLRGMRAYRGRTSFCSFGQRQGRREAGAGADKEGEGKCWGEEKGGLEGETRRRERIEKWRKGFIWLKIEMKEAGRKRG